MQHTTSRRRFLKGSAAAASFLIVTPSMARTFAANEKIRMANIGIGGQGGRGLGAARGEQLIAVADVDLQGHAAKALENVKKQNADVKVFTDFRKLFDEVKDLDAAWVATPDHTHFAAAVRAIDRGIAVFSEKPLTHNIYEARKLAELTKQKKIVTQMGNQGHGGEPVRLLCEYIWQGTLGDVTEVYSSQGGAYTHGGRRPAKMPPGLDWDAWLGPVAMREYHAGVHPGNWRAWVDFGTGMMGDFWCHNADGAVWALKLDQADTVEVNAEVGRITGESFPPQLKVVWKFPERAGMKPCTLTWSNGMKQNVPRPPMLEEGRRADFCSLYLGTKGAAISTGWMGSVRLIPESFQKEVGKPKQVLLRVPGVDREFLNAVKTGKTDTCSNFVFSGRLVEIMHLGNVAAKAGRALNYDFRTGKFVNDAPADALLGREPRKGWEFGYT